jgi:signal transduction histidine kinase
MPMAKTIRMERQIARCRVLLSLAAIVTVYIDPQTPLLARWIPFVSGRFMMDSRLFAVMAAHLVYSIVMYVQTVRGLSPRTIAVTAWIDMIFAVIIAVMTEGVTSPAYPFLAFAVVSAGLLSGPRRATLITTVSLVLYLCLLVVSTHEDAETYLLRPVYLAITGYLLVYLGQQRIDAEERIRSLEVADQRHRIARDLHDGYAQALAGVNLRLEAAREQLAAGASEQVLADLTRLQTSVQHEYDDLRDYVRSLAGVGVARGELPLPRNTRIRLRADFAGSPDRLTNVLSIVREGLSNIVRHASAHSASIEIHSDGGAVRVVIRDDGVGYRGQKAPWSIDSRVREAGGQIRIGRENAGTDLQITLPQQ